LLHPGDLWCSGANFCAVVMASLGFSIL
jgi:hypothetical protein